MTDPSKPSDPNNPEYDITTSDHDTSGDMGVSSETEGPTGPGQHGTFGTRDVSPEERDDDAEVPPEQAAGGVETNPDPPMPPKSGYNSQDPRSDDHPYDPTPRV